MKTKRIKCRIKRGVQHYNPFNYLAFDNPDMAYCFLRFLQDESIKEASLNMIDIYDYIDDRLCIDKDAFDVTKEEDFEKYARQFGWYMRDFMEALLIVYVSKNNWRLEMKREPRRIFE